MIVNEILEDDAGELQWGSTCISVWWARRRAGEQERQAQALLNSEDRGYKAALLSTFARTRTLVTDGKL